MPTVKFRQNTIKSLPYSGSGNAQCIYWEAGFPCFGTRVYPNGRRSYVCSYRVQGRKRLATLGRVDILTLEQARKQARAFLGQAASGEDPQADSDALYASGSVRSLCEEYLERHAKAKKRSWKADQSLLNRVVIPKLGSRLAASITSDDVGKLHSGLGVDTPYAANRTLEVIRKMFNLARIWRRVPVEMQNPASGIEDFKEEKRRRYVTPAEMPKLAEAIDAESNEYARHALWLLLLTGLRRNELLHAKWNDIDWEQRTLYVGKTKNGDPVLAPLSRAALDRLKRIRRIDDNPYIICGAIDAQPLVNLRKPWTRVRKSCGLDDVRIHDLRRTVGSWLVRDGASLHLVGAVLNHKDQKTTAGYAYFQTQDRTKALDKHGKKLIDLVARHPIRHVNKGKKSTTATIASRSTDTHAHQFTRKELHTLVWSKPISTLAVQLGVSDVGLSKACRRADIPVPARGYWAMREAGQTTQKHPLPPPRHHVPEHVVIRGRSSERKLSIAGSS